MPNNPTLLPDVMGVNAEKNSIPTTDNGTTGKASIKELWQSINSLPLSAGGKAVDRLDFNGLFSLLGGIDYMTQRGYTFEYDNTLPYVVGCIVIDTLDGKTYRCVNDVPAGGSAPSSDNVNWIPYDIADYVGGALRLTNYSVGDTSTLPNIPAGYFLECTTGGTTGAVAPVVTTSVSAGDTIADGTAVWTVRNCLPTSGGMLIGPDFYRNGSNSLLRLAGFDLANNGAGSFLELIGANEGNTYFPGGARLYANNGSGTLGRLALSPTQLLFRANDTKENVDEHSYDLGGSAIVGKNLASTGYIKYASGFIIQWGGAGLGTHATTTFPVSFTSTPKVCAVALGTTNVLKVDNVTTTTFYMETSSATSKMWIAVGY